MTNTDEARRAVRETIEHLGGIDIVLANAVRILVSMHGERRVTHTHNTGVDQVLRLEGS